eukprot:2860427-Pleurochrysis_carterae.AAC.1
MIRRISIHPANIVTIVLSPPSLGGVVENNKKRKKGAKTQRGTGGPKDYECGKGAREAKWRQDGPTYA